MGQPLTKDEVTAMVNDWYQKLDVHAPMVDILPLVSEGELRMVFPEATLASLAEFEGWYQRVIRTFFDEVHTMKALDVSVNADGSQADIKLCVYWEASVWSLGDRLSKRLMMDAYQTWVVKRSAATGKPVITTYIVDKLDPKPGSAPLMSPNQEIVESYYRLANANDWMAWCDLFADDMIMDEQLAGHIDGLTKLREMMSGMKAAFPTFQNKPRHIIVNGDEGAVVSHLSIVNASGQAIEADVMNYFRFKNGKISYMSNYHDTKPFDPK